MGVSGFERTPMRGLPLNSIASSPNKVTLNKGHSRVLDPIRVIPWFGLVRTGCWADVSIFGNMLWVHFPDPWQDLLPGSQNGACQGANGPVVAGYLATVYPWVQQSDSPVPSKGSHPVPNIILRPPQNSTTLREPVPSQQTQKVLVDPLGERNMFIWSPLLGGC